MRRSNCRRQDETNFSALEFFVELQPVENFLARKICRQPSRQFEYAQKIDNCISLVSRQTGFLDRDGARRNNSEADSFAVEKFPIITRAFNRVADSMTKVEQRAFSRLIQLVFGNDARFYLDVALDKWSKFPTCLLFGSQVGNLRHSPEHFCIRDDGVLDDFGEALVELVARQSF